MSRRRAAVVRKIRPDPKYHSLLLAKFINIIMKKGKKSIAEGILYGAMDLISAKGHGEPAQVVETAIDKVSPNIEVKSRRVGGSTYQVPIEVRASRKVTLSMRWILDAAKSRKNNSMRNKLCAELMDACEGKGQAIKKKEDTHRMAEANRAFAHFKW